MQPQTVEKVSRYLDRIYAGTTITLGLIAALPGVIIVIFSYLFQTSAPSGWHEAALLVQLGALYLFFGRHPFHLYWLTLASLAILIAGYVETRWFIFVFETMVLGAAAGIAYVHPGYRTAYEILRIHRLAWNRFASFPPIEIIETELRQAINQKLPTPARADIEEQLLTIAMTLYRQIFRDPLPEFPAGNFTHTQYGLDYIAAQRQRVAALENDVASYAAFKEAITSSLASFFGHIRPQARHGGSIFSAPTLSLLDSPAQAARDLISPFLQGEQNPALTVIRSRYYAALTMATQKVSTRRAENREWVSQQEYEREYGTDRMIKDLVLTEFHPLFDMSLPFKIVDDKGQDLWFQHAFVVGAPGSGKTNFLSALINTDFPAVEEGRASVVVIDSQNELIPLIAHLEQFAPDTELGKRLVYLEYDPDWPLQLNIFDVNEDRLKHLTQGDRDTLIRGAQEMAEFFISSVVDTDVSAHMKTVLGYLIPAMLSMPEATVFTLQELLEEGNEKKGIPSGYEKFKHLMNLEAHEKRFMEQRLYTPEFGPTRAALKARLDGFQRDKAFRRMFQNPKSKLDLFAELQTGKVILINTNKADLKRSTEDFGRFFIAKLLQATEERMLIDKRNRLPVYVYIDEAGDYISRERNIAELLDKARKQLVSMTIAVQGESQIADPQVLAALRRAAIQVRLRHQGYADISLLGAPPVTVSVPKVDFSTMPRMSRNEWSLQRAHSLIKHGAHYKGDTPEPEDTDEAEPNFDPT